MSFTIDQLLIFAVRAGNQSLAAELISLGADPNYFDPSHGSAAMACISRGDIYMLSLLLEHGLTPTGAAALGYGGLVEAALHHHHTEIAVLLADRGFHLVPHSLAIYREQLENAFSQRKKVEQSPPPNC
jgi:hypothetical protein